MFYGTTLGVIVFNILPATVSIFKISILHTLAPISFDEIFHTAGLEDIIKWFSIVVFAAYAVIIIFIPTKWLTKHVK